MESFVREVQCCDAVVAESIVAESIVADSIVVMSIFAIFHCCMVLLLKEKFCKIYC